MTPEHRKIMIEVARSLETVECIRKCSRYEFSTLKDYLDDRKKFKDLCSKDLSKLRKHITKINKGKIILDETTEEYLALCFNFLTSLAKY